MKRPDKTTHPLPRSLAALAAVMVFALPAAAQESGTPGDVIGTAGDLEVRAGEVTAHLATLTREERGALRGDPAAFGRYLRALLVQRLVLREALAAEWDKSAAVAERMRILREGIVANTWLESKGAAPEGYPNEKELAEAYEANRESFLQPKSWQLAQIFVAAPRPAVGATEPAGAEAKMKRIEAALGKDPAAFAKLAAAESEEPVSAAKGGEIGWLTEERIHPDIRAVVPRMKLGEISAPVRMDDGWHFVRILDIRETRIPTLEQVRGTLAEQLRAEKARAGTEGYLSGLLRNHPVAINEVALSKLLSPSSE
ncbi:MAG: peptidylprolyl isomerase [Verrucomicrobia bacterium]|nr:peptidylprolyl isomerase [Verrucomicrobiota bacterium]